MKEYLNIAQKAILKAGKTLKKDFNSSIKVNSSIGKDIKLQSDLDSEKIILDILSAQSDIPILSEEFGYLEKKAQNNYRWIIDPLDGTLNYSRSISINCISIGLWDGNKPLLGVIYDFIHDSIFTGIVGESAKLNGETIFTSNITNKKNAILCTGFPVYSNFSTENLSNFVSEIQDFKKVRLLGSAALSLSLVAKGSVEAYKENDIAIWDVAAGIPIIMAAGGVCEISAGKSENLLNVYAYNGKLK
tara:strand:- start:2056 stop:2793 length:738 start_codon:yes stop_codon:yes gene_type:complete